MGLKAHGSSMNNNAIETQQLQGFLRVNLKTRTLRRLLMKRAVWLSLTLFLLTSGGASAGYITPDLDAQLEKISSDDYISTIVMLSDRVDIDALKIDLNAMHTTRAHRHEIVVNTLREKTQNTQGELLEYLEGGIADGKVREYKSLWISNIVIVEATKSFIKQLSDRADVSDIYFDYQIESIKPVSSEDAPQRTTASIEEGLERINAPALWAMGYTGAGRLVSNLDTGVHGTHAALTDRYRGNHEPAEECWYDPVTGTDYPFDAGSHGTHTMGTICGYEESTDDHIGVAYEAEWIAAGVIDRVNIETTIADAITAFEWIADPDGNPQTIDDVPDVCSNSWRISPIYHSGYLPEGPCDQMFWSVLDGCEAAGVVVVFAAGNEGNSPPNSIGNPPNRAVDPYNSFAVGAIDGSNYGNDPIASFSSWGPVPEDCGEYTTKPEISTPGVNVRSSVPYGYSTMSGTSMACPHAAGAVAILRHVNPNATSDEIKAALMASAQDLGPDGEDNTYGWGLVNLEEAFYIIGPDEIRGLVRNSYTGHTMDSVMVEVLDPYKFDYTDQYGFYSMKGDFPDSVQITADIIGYQTNTEWIDVIQEGITYHNIWMNAINPGYLAGYVTDIDTGEGIGGVLSVYHQSLMLDYTDIDGVTGYYSIEVPAGTWTVTIDPVNPYLSVSEPSVVIAMGDTTYLDFELAGLTEFVEVSGAAGIGSGGFGQGVSFVDYDGDGDEDIFQVNLIVLPDCGVITTVTTTWTVT
jgi:bacillopeptidase F